MEISRQLENIGVAIAPMLISSVFEIRLVAEVHDDWLKSRYDIVNDGKLIEEVEACSEVHRSVNDALPVRRCDMLQ